MFRSVIDAATRAFSAVAMYTIDGKELSKQQKIVRKLIGFVVVLPLGVLAIFSWKIFTVLGVLLLATFAMREYLSIVRKSPMVEMADSNMYLLLVVLVSGFSLPFDDHRSAMGVLMVVMIGFGFLSMSRSRLTQLPSLQLMIGLSYVGLFASMILVRNFDKQIYLTFRGVFDLGWHDQGSFLLVIVILGVIACDSFAFLGGKTFGKIWKRKLAPGLSPNKTILGSATGLIGAVLTVIFFSWLFDAGISYPAILGVIVGITGPVGDLAESGFKRMFGVDDSGEITRIDFFGFGGVLDRFDSHLFAVSAAYIYFSFFS